MLLILSFNQAMVVILDEKLPLQPPPPYEPRASSDFPPSLGTGFTTSRPHSLPHPHRYGYPPPSRSSPTLVTLPPHVLLYIVHQTLPQTGLPYAGAGKVERQRKVLYWMTISLRLVNRAFYIGQFFLFLFLLFLYLSIFLSFFCLFLFFCFCFFCCFDVLIFYCFTVFFSVPHGRALLTTSFLYSYSSMHARPSINVPPRIHRSHPIPLLIRSIPLNLPSLLQLLLQTLHIIHIHIHIRVRVRNRPRLPRQLRPTRNPSPRPLPLRQSPRRRLGRRHRTPSRKRRSPQRRV